jgi:nicotinate-nucleotide pyrophosphorylase (carboxylating)
MNDWTIDLDAFISNAIKEDVGDGDHTSLACVPADGSNKAHLLVKEKGILAGVEVAHQIFNHIDPELKINVHLTDGSEINSGDIAFEVTGSARSILKAERLVLNCMQRMSGIATNTRKYVDLVKDYPCKILDTRKTTPGFRVIEKWAVRLGGGVNHRFGLYDMIMIKDNHVDYAGGIENAIVKTRNYLKEVNKDLKIEVEARNLTEVKEILALGHVDRIMLDNFSIADLKTAIQLINKRCETEASGGITDERVVEYAACGVDFISVGALTHQIKSLDLSLKANLK